MKNRKTTVILLIIFFVGLSVMLYPLLADYWNSRTQSRAIVNYQKVMESTSREKLEESRALAETYNRALGALSNPLREYAQVEGYWEALNPGQDGMMGYLVVEKLGMELPIYHGTSDEVLSQAVGHLEGTSLPVGGEGTHAVVSAHRGLPTAELFTYLNRLEVGDTFRLRILDRELSYRVDQIRIVEPDNAEYIRTQEGQDFCTLLTCTPYGINSQRLLVRGTRVQTQEAGVIQVENQAYRVDTPIVMLIVALPMVAVLTLFVMLKPVKKVSGGEETE